MLVLFYAFPLLSLLFLSFLTSESGHVRVEFTLANYAAVFSTTTGRMEVILKTLTVGLEVVALSTIISVPLAYYLAKVVRSPRAQVAVLMLFAAAFLVGPLVRTVSWRGILGINGLINTALVGTGVIDEPLLSLLYGRPAILVAMTYNVFPFMLFTVFLSMKMIDDRYIAAARDLGASAMTAFWRVVVPLAAPGLVAGAVLVFVPVLSAVLVPEMLGGTSGRLTPTAIRSQFFHTMNWPLGAALTVVFTTVAGVTIGLLAYLVAIGARWAGRPPLGRSA